LRARQPEIEHAILTRAYSLDDPSGAADPTYTEGLRAAVRAAVAYGIAGIERSEFRPAPIPTALFAQARYAARSGVSLDTVLRRYFAGYSVLSDFLDQEMEATGQLSPDGLRILRRDQAALLDRLLAAVAEEYEREARTATSPARRQAELVRRLLAGELLDTAELPYRFEGWHLAIVIAVPPGDLALRELATVLDCQLLLVEGEHGVSWAWLGGRARPDPAVTAAFVADRLAPRVATALGEPGEGSEGWRLSHRQAAAALPVAQRGPRSVARYSEVVLLAAALQNEVLADSLRQLYLDSLAVDRDGGASLRKTLRAYFAADRNSASAAAALGITRQTVNNRVRAVEERLGRPLATCAVELEVALRLAELDEVGGPAGRHWSVN
jgi:hypothetical protein